MLREAAILGVLILSGSCKSEGGDSLGSAATTSTGSATKSGSGGGGGFSADLAKELGSGSSGKADGSAGTKAGSATDRAGSAAVTMAGSDAPKAGSDASKAGSDAPKAGSNAVAMTGSAAKPEPAPKAGSDAPKAGSNAVAGAVAMTGSAAKPEPTPKAAATPASGTSTAPEAHGPVKVSAELAAIKLSLLPNWDRDVDEAGTFQYVVRIKGTQSTKTFSFRYGYDDPKAPADRDQYKKYLQDSKVLVGEIKDRQRGAAWFLEGTDASGLPAFRYMVLYGGKRLICYGSLYKDADSSRLGDDRDQTVIQAKQICETLAL
jgi:hypothetical protein